MENQKNERKILYLGGFLHDIGKAVQRSSTELINEKYYGSHPEQGYKFLLAKKELLKNHLEEDEISLLLKLIQAHHENEKYFSNEENLANKIIDNRIKCLATIVSRADNFSSSERDKSSQEIFNWNKQKVKPLYSIFQRIELEKENQKMTDFFNFEKLNFNNVFQRNYNSVNDLKILIEDFNKNLEELLKNKEIKNIDYGLNYLIYNYFWCIPANTKEDYPDISLYDHLKTTSAISTCIYDYHKEKNELENYEKISDDSIPRFRLVSGDFSGIQKYIFDISKQKSSGKRIRARSFFVQMLLEDVKNIILKEFDLPIFNVVFQSGGKFFILLPNTKNVESRINEIQKRINNESINNFNGEIALNLGLSDEFSGRGNDILSFKNFEEVLENSLENLSIKKESPLLDYLTNEKNGFTINQNFEGKSLCNLCRKFPNEKSSISSCLLCNQDIKIGEKLTESVSLFICFSNEGKFKLFESRFDIETEINKNYDLIIALNPNIENIKLNILENNFIISYLGNYISQRDFEELSMNSCNDKSGNGMKMLGILKADIDNLGKIFSIGLNRDNSTNYNTISRQSTMSRMLDLFFSGYINNIIEENYPDCYILYSGGDDLVIMGPWDQIISSSQKINNEFKRYINNQDITLSAGIFFCSHNYPIFRSIQRAEELLEEAKNNNKDSICLFDHCLKWEEFNKMYPEHFSMLDNWMEKNDVSNQFIRGLLNYGKMITNSKENKNLMMWQPYLAYSIGRNLEKKEEIKVWTEKILGMNKELEENEVALFNIIRNNLSLIAQYALYRNRK